MKINACDAHRLSTFLDGRLMADEEQDLIVHLDECSHCREKLEQNAAKEIGWAEVNTLLSPLPLDEPLVPAEGSEQELPLPVRQVLNLLAPTDDPSSLGRIDGFEVLGVVGAGAMGVVLKAEDRTLDRIVALKVMNPSLAASGTARARFAREARAAAAILHPNVIPIHAVSASHELPYLVMPYVTGTSLQQRLNSEGPMSLPEILRIGSQLAAGLSAAHKTGVIHRDIKPSNVMLDTGVETALITDFGLARTIDDATLTRSGAITGTPEYMSPEQARGEAIGFSSDLFSLGSVLYSLCTGRPPFRAQTAFGVLRRISDNEPRPIRDVNPDIPHWLVELIDRLLSKNPTQRPTADEAHVLAENCLAHVYEPDRIAVPEELTGRQFSAVGFSRPLMIGMTMIVAVAAVIFAIGPFATHPEQASSETPPASPFKVGATEKTKAREPVVFKTLNLDFPDPTRTGSVVIDINRGFVEVEAHDQPGVIIEILKPPASRKQKGLSLFKEQFSPSYDLTTDREKNEIDLDTYNQNYVLNMRVKVPLKTNLSLDTYYDGYLRVEGVSGSIDTHSQNCDISLLNISGAATASSYNGTVNVTFRKLAKDARLDFESYNGSIDLTFPHESTLTTAISAGRGTFRSMFDIEELDATERDALLAGVTANTDSYQLGKINGGGIPIRIESEKGVITLRDLDVTKRQTNEK